MVLAHVVLVRVVLDRMVPAHVVPVHVGLVHVGLLHMRLVHATVPLNGLQRSCICLVFIEHGDDFSSKIIW